MPTQSKYDKIIYHNMDGSKEESLTTVLRLSKGVDSKYWTWSTHSGGKERLNVVMDSLVMSGKFRLPAGAMEHDVGSTSGIDNPHKYMKVPTYTRKSGTGSGEFSEAAVDRILQLYVHNPEFLKHLMASIPTGVKSVSTRGKSSLNKMNQTEPFTLRTLLNKTKDDRDGGKYVELSNGKRGLTVRLTKRRPSDKFTQQHMPGDTENVVYLGKGVQSLQ